jgi:hypothetical protein
MGDIEVIEGDSGMRSHIVPFDDAQLDLYFKMHEKVNAKSEEISKSYKNNILVEFNDIQELHDKVVQSINSLKPQNGSLLVRVIVSHHEGEAEKFNSFDDFKNHNITSPNPTSEIGLMYKFSHYDNETGEIENYKVVANIKSRIGELHQIEQEAPPFISSAIISSMVTSTARIKVEYTDYVKARHFIAMFDEWIKGCDESKEIKHINSLKKISHLISRFGHLLIVGLLGWFVSGSIEIAAFEGSALIRFLVIYASIFYIISSLAELCLKKLELSIDSYLAISYLKINKGDNKLIKEFKSRNTSSIFWSVLGILGTVGVGMCASASYDLIKYLITKS